MCDKPNIILDLDNTIISSVTPKEYKTIKDNAKGLKFTPMEHYYKIFHRPYLQDFLDYIFDNFNVSVWTAGSKDYCLFIVKNIIMNHLPHQDGTPSKGDRTLRLILHEANCEQSEKMYQTETPKDLRYIYNFEGFSKNNSFIVDDLDQVQKVNKDNVLPAKYFDVKRAGAYNDVFLRDAIPRLKKILDEYYVECKL